MPRSDREPTVFSPWLFALLTFVSATLALYLSFRFELDRPGAAALTVMVVARPDVRDLLPMSVWRSVGTFAGTLVALLLIALFAQSPWLFVIGFAAWMGACVFVSVYLPDVRHFGIALAGFTPALIAAPALQNMSQVFEIAMDRMAVVIVGVLSTALVFVLFAPAARLVAPVSAPSAHWNSASIHRPDQTEILGSSLPISRRRVALCSPALQTFPPLSGCRGLVS